MYELENGHDTFRVTSGDLVASAIQAYRALRADGVDHDIASEWVCEGHQMRATDERAFMAAIAA